MSRRPPIPPRLVAALLLVSTAAAGRPAGLRAQDAAAEEPHAWKAQLELGFDGSTGNKTFAILRSALSLTHLKTDVAEFETSASYRYGTSEGEVVANEARTSLKLDIHPRNVWSPFAFATALRDPIRRIDVRSSGGGGVKYTFARGETGSASISDALLFEYENLARRGDPTVEGSKTRLRWSVRLKAEKTLDGEAKIQHTSFFQPVFDHLGDYLIEATTQISTPVFGDLDLAVEHEYLRDSTPVEGVKADDQRFSVLFRLQL